MKTHKGFTLIELIVVMAVFMLVIGAAISIFLSMIQSQRRVLAEEQLLNQISYVEEYMSKALRMAKADNSPTPACLIDGQFSSNGIYLLTNWNGVENAYEGIKFINANDNNVCQSFFLENSVLYEKKGSSNQVALTSANLQIKSVKFLINGSANQGDRVASIGDGAQPRITVLLNVAVPGESARTIQTTVSLRNLNVQQ